MKISIRDLSFAYSEKNIFEHFNAELDGGGQELPLVILGPSGCGKTTLLKLLGGLLKTESGSISYSDLESSCGKESEALAAKHDDIPNTSFIFQESRLLPWLSVIENVSLPIEKIFGKEEARKRAQYFLSLVFMDSREKSYPKELSGGQAQRVSMARAFAWPAKVLLMDEPFQSLDIPLRLSLMDLCLSLLEKTQEHEAVTSQEKPLLVAVTHDPREAIYLGGRIIVLGEAGEGIVLDKLVDLDKEERAYGSVRAGELERELLEALYKTKIA